MAMAVCSCADRWQDKRQILAEMKSFELPISNARHRSLGEVLRRPDLTKTSPLCLSNDPLTWPPTLRPHRAKRGLQPSLQCTGRLTKAAVHPHPIQESASQKTRGAAKDIAAREHSAPPVHSSMTSSTCLQHIDLCGLKTRPEQTEAWDCLR